MTITNEHREDVYRFIRNLIKDKRKYLKGQQQHHNIQSFDDEYNEMLSVEGMNTSEVTDNS